MIDANEVEARFEAEVQAYLDRLPRHMVEAITNYVVLGRPVGDFLYAVLSNNLMEAVGRADDLNIKKLREWVQFLYFAAPSKCWGSPEAIKAWMAHGGLSHNPPL